METIRELFGESTLSDDSNPNYPISGSSISIIAGASFSLPIKVDKKRSLLTWEFTTIGYDILFGIMKHEGGSKMQHIQVNPLLSYSPNKVHSGSLTINETGTYVLVWDNSHSWLREKTINYKVDLRKLERSNEEISSFSKKVCNCIYDKEQQLNATQSSITAKVAERSEVEQIQLHLLNQLQETETAIHSHSEMITHIQGEVEVLQSTQEQLHHQVEYLRRMAPFLVEGERIFSMLHGVDLLRVACVNHLLHDAVYQDGIWNRVFFQEEPESLAPVMQNDHLRVMYDLVNPSPISKGQQSASKDTKNEVGVKKTEDSKEIQSAEPAESVGIVEPEKPTESIKENSSLPMTNKETVPLKDLSLLYKITEKQGWYKDKHNQCYFIRFRDSSKKTLDVLFPAISATELDSLIRQTLKSSVLIPMPGTEAGKSGYYIDRFRRISKWNVDTVESDSGPTLKWTEVQL